MHSATQRTRRNRSCGSVPETFSTRRKTCVHRPGTLLIFDELPSCSRLLIEFGASCHRSVTPTQERHFWTPFFSKRRSSSKTSLAKTIQGHLFCHFGLILTL
ncbi:hypothetical protein TNCV_3849171 [Trichonephila clavipes]|uniref:Uncharacterized protein n=1 Tax=Trichonephila clavipes TaxID=2585209 RepID=A0A8X6RJ36_TRICX|nr:hypothetical protein TNCV_3849171 [Trichonephila clavipes]